MVSDTASTQTLSPPPRPLTPGVRRRAWTEPHVRFWWLAGAALVAAGAYMLVVNYVAWRREVWLIRNGTLVNATIERSNAEVLAGRPVAPEMSVMLAFDWKGEQVRSWGTLEGRRPKEVILTKSTVPIRVHPDDPERWTYRREPPGLAADLLGAALAFALAPLAFVASFVLRRGVLRTWREGTAAEAVVIARHGTALAPGARAVKCSPAAHTEEGGEAGSEAVPTGGSRVHTVYVPLRHAEAGEGVLRVILPPGGRGRPLSVAWFES